MKYVIELQYFPCIAYFWLAYQAEDCLVDVHEHYVKQTYRNRTVINAANGPLTLTIPVKHLHPKMKVKDVEVDHRQKWSKNHWRTIQSAYGKAPFFDYYAPYLSSVFETEKKLLIDYQRETLSICQKLLGLDLAFHFSEKYVEKLEGEVFDLRSSIHPKLGFGKLSGFEPKPYIQLFGKDFVPNLSILDLLFCEGPNASSTIQNSGKINKEQLQKTTRFVL